jgi:hypothetical protein
VERNKIVIGIQMHAVTYTLLNEAEHGVNAPINQTNKAGSFSQQVCRAGRQPYFEVVLVLNE